MCALLLAAALLAVAAAAGAAEIRGTVTYRERMALPEGARLAVDLLDVSKADVAAERVTGATYAVTHQVPIGFLLPYDPATIDARHRYALSARILVGEELTFRSEGTTPVLTQGAGERVDMLLHRAAAPAAAGAEALTGRWIAETIGGGTVATGVTSSLTLAADGTAHGTGGCNNFAGGWKLDGAALTLGPMGATMMACPPPASEQEAAFFRAFDATRGFRFEDGVLVLVDAGGAPLVRLQRRP
jgi:putative lipoprotein